jgi:hypothetical protein
VANLWYPKGLEGFMGGDIALDADTIKATLVDTADYTYNAAHDFIADVAAGARVATITLGSKSITDGIFDAADGAFATVTGDQSEAIVIWQDTGNEATSRLIAYIDTATGLPVTPNGGNINVAGSST